MDQFLREYVFWLYQFLIFALFLTFIINIHVVPDKETFQG